MKKVLAFDIDQTLNIAKTPVTADVAELLRACLGHFFIVPISGQKFEQFLVQIVEPLTKVGVTGAELEHLHLLTRSGISKSSRASGASEPSRASGASEPSRTSRVSGPSHNCGGSKPGGAGRPGGTKGGKLGASLQLPTRASRDYSD